jgi:hypothetical protein
MVNSLQATVGELETLAGQAAVHRKKFEYSVSQIRYFFDGVTSASPVTPKQSDAYKTFVLCLRNLRDLICEHQIQTWAHPTLENSSNYIPSTLTDLAGKLQAAGSVLSADTAAALDPDAPQWLQYHILDLKGISASFHQYLDVAKPNDAVAPMMRARLASVDTFIDTYEGEDVAPGMRIFSPIPVHYQIWRLNHEDFESIREIGGGISANVFYGKDNRTGQEVAVKQLKFQTLSGSKLQTFQREVSILASVDHPALLRFIGATDSPPFCIVTAWMAGGTLYHGIHKAHRLSPTQLTICAFDIACGMQYLHSRNIIHRDLKSLNVLLDNDDRAHICDFGFSRTAEDDAMMTQNIGTPHWMAPELLTANAIYTSKVDVYAYGLVLWEIVSLQVPFTGLDPTQIMVQVYMHNIRPVMPSHVNPKLRELIRRCWDRNPDVRPTFDEIVELFVTEKIMVDGTIEAEFSAYIGEKCGPKPSPLQDSHLVDADADAGLDGVRDEEALARLAEGVRQKSIRMAVLSRYWDVVQRNVNAQAGLVSQIALGLLVTPVKVRAANLLRRLPCGSIPLHIIAEAVKVIPTGSEDFDQDLIIAACKNGAADSAAIYAILPQHLRLTLEVVGQHGAELALRPAVADKCVQALGSKDVRLVCAGARCLIGIGEARRIRPDSILWFVRSDVQYMRYNGIVAATAMAIAGTDVNSEVIDAVMAGPDDAVSETFLVTACRQPHAALQIVNRVAYGEKYNAVIILKILLMAARHQVVWPAIMVTLQRIDLSSLQEQWGRELGKLMQLVGHVPAAAQPAHAAVL